MIYYYHSSLKKAVTHNASVLRQHLRRSNFNHVSAAPPSCLTFITVLYPGWWYFTLSCHFAYFSQQTPKDKILINQERCKLYIGLCTQAETSPPDHLMNSHHSHCTYLYHALGAALKCGFLCPFELPPLKIDNQPFGLCYSYNDNNARKESVHWLSISSL